VSAAVDLRSDTVTKPGSQMRAAMAAAQVGDDVYGEDPTVIALQNRAAKMLGKDAALFVPSGTQSNLTAVLTHCARGDEYIAGDTYHIYCSEAAGAAVLGGIAPFAIRPNPRGGLDAKAVVAAMKNEDIHYPRSKLLCLENTVHGRAQSAEEMNAAIAPARKRGLAAHLDGARLFNAAVALGCRADELTRDFDSVSLCLSKGLGAPVGSVLCGDAAFIKRAKRNRKILGGGMRQAGVLAAAGIYALEHHIARLADDHSRAQKIAAGLAAFMEADYSGTNMVFAFPKPSERAPLIAHLAGRGVLVGGRGDAIRIVVHLDISDDDADFAVGAFGEFFRR
jgi:threonine aldolase